MLRMIFPLEVLTLAGPVGDPNDYYLALRGFGGYHLDHPVLYFGKQDTAQHMKSADVLFVGSSRINFALQHTAKERLGHLGLTHYMLGFGYGEADKFPLTIIRKHDLRPKYVVVNAEVEFFVDRCSTAATEVMRLTLFEYRKIIFEEQRSHDFQGHLHSVLPHWSALAFRPCQLELSRCKSDGAWAVPQNYPWAPTPIEDPGDLWHGVPHPGKLSDVQKVAANRFKEEMDKRGVKIIVTHVPYPSGHRRWAELFAKHLNAPLVAPVLDGLETCDDNHLNPRSARRWADAFYTELESVLRPNSGTSSQRP